MVANNCIAYGFDEFNKEFIIGIREITLDEYNLDKHLSNESRVLIECKNRFYDIGISLETIFNKNINVLNDNEKDDLIIKMVNLSSFDIRDLNYIHQDNYTFTLSMYGYDSIIWMLFNGMITTRI